MGMWSAVKGFFWRLDNPHWRGAEELLRMRYGSYRLRSRTRASGDFIVELYDEAGQYHKVRVGRLSDGGAMMLLDEDATQRPS